MTTPAVRLLEFILPGTILRVREPGGASAYMADYGLIVDLVLVDGVEGVGSSNGLIRFLRLTATRPEIERRLAQLAVEREKQAKHVERERRRAIRPTPESRFSLKFTYREQVGDTRLTVLKRATVDKRYVTWGRDGFNPHRWNPDAIPEPLRRF